MNPNWENSEYRESVFSQSEKVGTVLRILAWSILLFVLFWATSDAHAQDVFVPSCATRPNCTLVAGQAWDAATHVWIFSPIYPNASIRFFLHNNNTANGHTLTFQVFDTGSNLATSLSAGADQWTADSVTNNSVVNASCTAVAAKNTGTPGASGMGSCYVNAMFSAQIAVRISGAAAAAGTVDTYDLTIVQQAGYISGPQPGADSSSGVGTSLASIQTNNVPITLLGSLPVVAAVTGIDANTNTGSGGAAQFRSTLFGAMDLAQAEVRPYTFNGTTWDRPRNQSGANATASANATGTTLPGMAITTSPATWTAATQATTASQCVATIAATATTRHCAVGVQACVSDTAAQPQLFINLRDGATGAGTIKWNALLDGTAGTSSCIVHEFAAGPICGTLNTAMTLEFGAATAATNGCTTTVRGYDVQP